MTTSPSEVTFDIAQTPVPASRPKFGKGGRTYYPKAHMVYEETLRTALLGLPAAPTDRPLELRFLFVQEPYKVSDHPVSRMDVDNLAKLPMDVMTKSEVDGVRRYWTDDSLIVALTALKRFARPGETPHTRVRIIPIHEDLGRHVDQLFEA